MRAEEEWTPVCLSASLTGRLASRASYGSGSQIRRTEVDEPGEQQGGPRRWCQPRPLAEVQPRHAQAGRARSTTARLLQPVRPLPGRLPRHHKPQQGCPLSLCCCTTPARRRRSQPHQGGPVVKHEHTKRHEQSTCAGRQAPVCVCLVSVVLTVCSRASPCCRCPHSSAGAILPPWGERSPPHGSTAGASTLGTGGAAACDGDDPTVADRIMR